MAVNVLALKHQAISIHKTDWLLTFIKQFYKNAFK